MNVGIVCEGATDFAVLDVLITSLVQNSACFPIHPLRDELTKRIGNGGWQSIRKFLRNSGLGLKLGFYDLVVIQVDASVRLDKEITKLALREAEEGEPDLLPFCEHVKSWVAGGVSENVLVALPREDLESWLLAIHTQIRDVESIPDPANELMNRGILSKSLLGSPVKEDRVFRQLAGPIDRLIRRQRDLARVPELERTVGKIRYRARSA